eukprot:869400-Alexandrium_andersonii.AAC.1
MTRSAPYLSASGPRPLQPLRTASSRTPFLATRPRGFDHSSASVRCGRGPSVALAFMFAHKGEHARVSHVLLLHGNLYLVRAHMVV